MWRHHELLLHGCGKCTQRGKGQSERERESLYHDQPEGSSDCLRWSSRRREGQRLNTDPALPQMGPHRDTMYLDQSVPKQCRQSWKVVVYQPYRRWSDWFWWPKCQNISRTRWWCAEPASQQRLVGVQPCFGTGTIRPVAVSTATLPALSVPAAARGGIAHSGTVADVSALRRGRRVHWGPVKYGYGNGSDWSVTARSCAQRKGSNREPGWCVDARPSPESDLCGNAQSEKYGMS